LASYEERILEVIGESDVGLTTVDVAKKAGVSKTTVIKYLSVLSSEGQVEFVEALPMVDIDFCNGGDNTIYFSFRVRPDQICSLIKRSKRCICDLADSC
jgi:hypothetical protein